MYTLGIYIYTLCALIASIFSKKIRKRIYGIGQTFRLLHTHIKPTDRVVWFHAAS